MYSKLNLLEGFSILKLRSILFITVTAIVLTQLVPLNSSVKASDLEGYITEIGLQNARETQFAKDINDSGQCIAV